MVNTLAINHLFRLEGDSYLIDAHKCRRVIRMRWLHPVAMFEVDQPAANPAIVYRILASAARAPCHFNTYIK